MDVVLYVVFVVLAAATTYVWGVRKTAVGAMTLLGAALWGVIAVRGGEYTTTTQCCRFVQDAMPMQVFGAGMTIISVGVFLLWYFGDYPVQEDEVPA